ncbi:MAG TPA: alpha/beta fold hydrolase, partial [Thermoanaerobaculia bacterium]|nr:alpha/beta fold hydrolase [Thermoanaerobaculia bacterium]
MIALVLVTAACTTDRTRRGYLEEAAPSLPPPERVVIVIPGFGVTRLFDPVTRRHVWGTARATMHTRFADDLDLPVEADGRSGRDRLVPSGYVGSRGPVNVGWQLMEALRKYAGNTPEKDVYPFHYDWRLSARDNASALSALVSRVSQGRKVDLVTHSAGALVALAYVKLGDGGGRVERLIMISPPRRGVIDAFRIFVRPERFLRRSFLPEMIATWPSVYELLPEEGRFLIDSDGAVRNFDAWRAETWPVRVSPALLEEARSFRDKLQRTPMPPGIQATVIAGDCVATARRALRRQDDTFAFYPADLRPDEQHLASRLFEGGDGTVPVSSATAGGPALLFCDGHQGIAT